MATNNMKQARQGDLFFEKLSACPAKDKDHSPVLALGESTGHMHQIAPEDLSNADIFLDKEGNVIVNVHEGKTAKLVHEEHKTIEFPEGTWQLTNQVEYTPDGWKQVAD